MPDNVLPFIADSDITTENLSDYLDFLRSDARELQNVADSLMRHAKNFAPPQRQKMLEEIGVFLARFKATTLDLIIAEDQIILSRRKN